MTIAALLAASLLSSAGGPMDALLDYARGTGPIDGLLLDSMLAEGGLRARLAAWARWSAGEPLPTGPLPWLVEYGSEEPSAGDLASMPAGVAVESLMMRILHAVSRSEQPALPALVDSLVREHLVDLPDSTLMLVLQVYGRLGSPGLPVERLMTRAGAGLRTRIARYCSETSTAIPGTLTADSVLDRVYLARILPPEECCALLGDPEWAVRYEAAGRADSTRLPVLLDDPVPCVALRAAARMQEAGIPGYGETLLRLAFIDGPVGHQAAALLEARDSAVIRELSLVRDPGRRLSAVRAWLGAGLPVDDGTVEEWLRDPYWLVPVVWLEHLATSDSAAARESAGRLLSTTDDRDLRRALLEMVEPGRGAEIPDGALPEGLSRFREGGRMIVSTDQGDLVLEMLDETAPVTCAAFRWLADSGFYNGLYFHRVIPGFVAQAGCPQGNGYGGPGFALPSERSPARFTRGVVGMADAGLDTGGSQFFIMLDDHDRLDCRYTAFARVEEGIGTMDRLSVGTRIEGIAPAPFAGD
jgi:peptidyl-prolyl cis-trans isomerase B (cyclophilin B)